MLSFTAKDAPSIYIHALNSRKNNMGLKVLSRRGFAPSHFPTRGSQPPLALANALRACSFSRVGTAEICCKIYPAASRNPFELTPPDSLWLSPPSESGALTASLMEGGGTLKA